MSTLFDTKFPDVHVKLTGEDGNAFFIIGRVSFALRKAGHADAVAEYQEQAMSGDYANVLVTTAQYVRVS